MTREINILVAALACLAGLGGFGVSGAAAAGASTTGAGTRHTVTAQHATYGAWDLEGQAARHLRARGLDARSHGHCSGHAVEASGLGSPHLVARSGHLAPTGAHRASGTRHHNTRAPPRKEQHP